MLDLIMATLIKNLKRVSTKPKIKPTVKPNTNPSAFGIGSTALGLFSTFAGYGAMNELFTGESGFNIAVGASSIAFLMLIMKLKKK